MSGKKRQSTLFNFFTKQTSDVENKNSPSKGPNGIAEDSDDEKCRSEKRSRILLKDDSSGSESEPEKQRLEKSKRPSKKRKICDSGKGNGDDSAKERNLDNFLPIKEKEKRSESSQPTTSQMIDMDLHLNDDPFQSNTIYVHDSLEFLKPENIRDGARRRPSDPNYDSRTLYVPESFLSKQTPVMFQWWQFKSKHMDTVLFLKVGKFYELYHMDAAVGVKELGFSYMKGDIAHSGFPESAYGKMISQLIGKGYKVARIEQTETPEMMESRLKTTKKPTKYDRVVKRELCQISSIGSMVYTAQLQDSKNISPHYMYAICMKNISRHTLRIGVCFAETSIGSFHLTEFEDDKHFSKLLFLLNEYPVSLILTERGVINESFNELLQVTFEDVKKEYISPKTEFYTASDTLEKLAESLYFKDAENKLQWPDLFKKLADNYSPKKEYEFAISSLGACLWYLKDCNLDIQVFSTAKFEWYDTYEQVNTKHSVGYMILDAATITNLNLLHCTDSLENVLNHCRTPFGYRLLHRWICRPLYDVVKIKERQNAVRELRINPDLLKSTQTILSLLPDLERQLTKIRIYGNKSVVSNHPDGRAIFYEELTYSKRKIQDFTQTIEAFERVQEIPVIFKSCDDKFLQQITQFSPIGVNIDLKDTITYIKSAVDFEQAAKDGKIIPKKGLIKEFDEVEDKIEEIQQELDSYLQKQCKIFGCKVTYVGNKKNRYQLSIPANKSRTISAEYKLQSGSTKSGTTLKYSTSETTRLLASMTEAECQRSKVILDLNRCIFEKFGERHDEMNQVIQCLAILDIICGFAEYAYKYPYDICMPEILPPCDNPKIAIRNGRNPCIDNPSFVPNDTFLGQDEYARMLLLTGPNMGGKSTLIRQTALIAIMAHIGSFVPAAACELNLIDRIFTRLGAQDNIIEGQSTLFTELSETSIILKYATNNSFVLIDELGRGTSTNDGDAIATAVLNEIASFKCCGIFSTHSHLLVDKFEGREDIQIGHMACMEENESDEVTEKCIIFLFKLAKGRCSKSYGFNVAKLAGVDNEVVSAGRKIAKEFEEKVLNRLKIIKLLKELKLNAELPNLGA